MKHEDPIWLKREDTAIMNSRLQFELAESLSNWLFLGLPETIKAQKHLKNINSILKEI